MKTQKGNTMKIMIEKPINSTGPKCRGCGFNAKLRTKDIQPPRFPWGKWKEQQVKNCLSRRCGIEEILWTI